MFDAIQRIKEFNRFYTRYIGLFNLYRDESSYSATEAMILFEIANHKRCTAAHLSFYFFLDKGYISRILKKLKQHGLIKKVISRDDRRIQYLQLTVKGGEELNRLAQNASFRVEKMIEGITKEDMEVLIQSMITIEELFSKNIVKGDENG